MPAEDFDYPIFKILAHNDTGAAKGHQGGFVLPKDLEQYLPLLRNRTDAQNPTVDQAISAELFDGAQFLANVETRYQFQTWGGERSPERRITGNIGKLRNAATGGDILVIERGIERENHYRFTLVKQGTPHFAKLQVSIGNRRWGVLRQGSVPILEMEVEEATEEVAEKSLKPFTLFDEQADFQESRSRRITRSRAFQRKVHEVYGNRCAVCSSGLLHPTGLSETEAGHIVPRSAKGADDIRNGILFCRSHHWAFDYGMIGIAEDFTVLVPDAVLNFPQNASLANFRGQLISLPQIERFYPEIEALSWHAQHIVMQ